MAILQTTVSGVSPASVFTAAAEVAITTAFFMNNSGADVTLSLMIVPGGGSGTVAANGIVKNLTIASGDTYILDVEKIILSSGDQLQAVCSAASAVLATVSYVTI